MARSHRAKDCRSVAVFRALQLGDMMCAVPGDTGVSHDVASGPRLPSVVVFFATDPQRWAPLDAKRHRIVYDPRGVDVPSVLRATLRLLHDTAAALRSCDQQLLRRWPAGARPP